LAILRFYLIFVNMIHLRENYIKQIHNALQLLPIVVLIGARQVGKTSIMKSLPLYGKTVFLDAQDPDVAELFKNTNTIKNYLKIHLDSDLNGFLLLDEFQFINEIHTKLKLLTDHNPKLKIICSGSSSITIYQHVKESLAGRVRFIDVYSLSFTENLMFSKPELSKLYEKYTIETDYAVIDKRFEIILNEYLIYGGFPRLTETTDTDQKAELLNDIYKTYLLRDVRSFIRNEDFVGFNKMLRILAIEIGNMINIHNISKSCGLSYRKSEEYLDLLEQMFIIQRIDPFHSNKKKLITKMKKLYFTDIGLRNVILGNFNHPETRSDAGALLENFVFLEISRKIKTHHKIYYYRTLDGSEVDFIIDTMETIIPVEVKSKAFKMPKTLKNIVAFNNSHSAKTSWIINKSLNTKAENTNFLPAVLISKF